MLQQKFKLDISTFTNFTKLGNPWFSRNSQPVKYQQSFTKKCFSGIKKIHQCAFTEYSIYEFKVDD